MNIAVNLIIFLLIVVGLVLLQVWLSKQESRIPGLILPALHLILSVVLILSVATFSAIETGAVTQETHVEVIQTDEAIEAIPDDSSVGIIGGADGPTAIFVSGVTGPSFPDPAFLLTLFLFFNIPTGIDLAIYAAVRRKLHHRKRVDKTLIQDL